MFGRLRGRVSAAGLAALTGFACGQTHSANGLPAAEGDTGGVASAGGATSAIAGGTGARDPGPALIPGGSSFIPVTGGWPSTVPSWVDRCEGAEPIALGALPDCSSEAPVVLRDRAAAEFALAVDAERVYFVSRPLPGEPCPDPDPQVCAALMSVPKNGGDVLVYRGTPRQLALDGDSIYWTMQALNVTPKLGGEPERLRPLSDGVIAVAGAIYTVEFPEPDRFATRLLRFSTSPTPSTAPATVAQFPAYTYAIHPLVTDGEWVFVVPLLSLSDEVQPLYAVRLTDGERRLASVNSLGGMAIAPNGLYVTEQRNGHLMRIDLRDGSTSSLCLSVSPRALAVDSTHIYFNSWPYLMERMSRGQLVRMALDGSSPCVLGNSLEFDSTPILDADSVYWIAAGRLYKAQL